MHKLVYKIEIQQIVKSVSIYNHRTSKVSQKYVYKTWTRTVFLFFLLNFKNIKT